MDIETLAHQAANLIIDTDRELTRMHGIEVSEGFFVLYNEVTGQSKNVFYHPDSGYVFKRSYEDHIPESLSGLVVGEATLDTLNYVVRLPRFHVFHFDGMTVHAQEYVHGESCNCVGGGWCEHSNAIREASNCNDSHAGNWKINLDNEIVLFDFEGIRV